MWVFYRRELWEKRGIHVDVYLSFGQIQLGSRGAGVHCTQPQSPLYPQPDTYCTHAPCVHAMQMRWSLHSYLFVLTLSRCGCVFLPAFFGPPRAGISLSFPQTHTHTVAVAAAARGGVLVGWLCETLALITCSSELLGLTSRPPPSPGSSSVPLRLLPASHPRSIRSPPRTPHLRPVAMTPSMPLFLLLLSLMGAQAMNDLRTAAAMGKNDL